MADKKPVHDFGKRRPVTVAPVSSVPVKRSGHVALLLMGTLAVGGGAYALMPSENCQQTPPGMAQPSGSPQAATDCRSGRHATSSNRIGSRAGFFSSDSSSGNSSSGSSDSGPGGVHRGGFGSFAHAFGGHFSGG